MTLRICAYVAELILFIGIVTGSGLLEDFKDIKGSMALLVLNQIGLLQICIIGMFVLGTYLYFDIKQRT
jgi:hypothetical protein